MGYILHCLFLEEYYYNCKTKYLNPERYSVRTNAYELSTKTLKNNNNNKKKKKIRKNVWLPGSLRHHHPPIVCQCSWYSTQHQYQSPCNINSFRRVINRNCVWCITVSVWSRHMLEYGTHDHRDRRSCQDSKPLHRKHGGYEGSTCPPVSELRHNRCRQRVVPTNPNPQKEPEKREAHQNALSRLANRKATAQRAQHHYHQCYAVHASPSYSVPESTENQLTNRGAQQSNRQRSWQNPRWDLVLWLVLLIVHPSD